MLKGSDQRHKKVKGTPYDLIVAFWLGNCSDLNKIKKN